MMGALILRLRLPTISRRLLGTTNHITAATATDHITATEATTAMEKLQLSVVQCNE